MTARTDGAWLPLADVLRHVAASGANVEQTADVDRVRLAAAAYVERLRPDLVKLDAGAVPRFLGGPDVVEGALLLAARLVARKASPTGLANYGEFGPATVMRLDPDVERLLGLGRYTRPRVG